MKITNLVALMKSAAFRLKAQIYSRATGVCQKTAEEFTKDGWFKTGDVGRWGGDANGGKAPKDYLCIVGRSKDLIISGGYNVYPKEIESFIDDMDGVDESAVIGIPHPDFGEAVMAVVVPKAGAKLDAQANDRQFKTQIANFKIPKRLEIVSDLPRNAMGKVQKNILAMSAIHQLRIVNDLETKCLAAFIKHEGRKHKEHHTKIRFSWATLSFLAIFAPSGAVNILTATMHSTAGT